MRQFRKRYFEKPVFSYLSRQVDTILYVHINGIDYYGPNGER